MVSVQCPDRGFSSKVIGVGRRPIGTSSHRVLLAGLMTPVALLLSGCGSGGDLISSVALPSRQTAGYAEGVEVAAPPAGERQSGTMTTTPAQQEYLDALRAAGVRTSNELRALSIGFYVCQARAAGHSEQAVWDSVAPKVRSDIAATGAAAQQAPAAVDADAAIGLYIRSATQLLC